AGLKVAAVVLHENRVVIEPLQSALSKQMRQAVTARLQLAIGHGLAGSSHDEGGLQRTEMSVLAGIHRLPIPYAAARRISYICSGPSILRGLRGTQGVAIAAMPIAWKCSGPTPTPCRGRGMPRSRIKASSTSAASAPGRPMAAATSACRSALADWFQRIT